MSARGQGPGPALYTGAEGEASAFVRTSSGSPGYSTARGTAGHYLLAPEDTDGRLSMYLWEMGPHSGGPGLHFHRTYDETFHVVSGTVRFHDGTRWFDVTAGDLLHVPAGGLHAFSNDSGAAASMLMILTPGADRPAYFDELARATASAIETSSEEWADLMRRHDNVVVTPPGD